MRRLLLCLLLAGAVLTGAPEPPTLRGVVLDESGRPLPGATVTLESPCGGCILVPGHSLRHVVTDAAGSFVIEEPSEPMEVVVTHPGHAPATEVARDGAVVRLKAAREITVSVPVDADVYVTRGLKRLASGRGPGDIRLGPLPDGEVTLHVASPRHRPYQRTLLADGTSSVGVDLDLGLALRGRVHPPRAGVVLRASQGEARESVAESDETGAFLVTGLREGEVCVVVLDGEDEPQVLFSEAPGHLDVEVVR
ncbi:MAG: carboxypeptidase-like regulatory domain-containing protein [Planctomycetota bacterium]